FVLVWITLIHQNNLIRNLGVLRSHYLNKIFILDILGRTKNVGKEEWIQVINTLDQCWSVTVDQCNKALLCLLDVFGISSIDFQWHVSSVWRVQIFQRRGRNFNMELFFNWSKLATILEVNSQISCMRDG